MCKHVEEAEEMKRCNGREKGRVREAIEGECSRQLWYSLYHSIP